MRSSVVKQEECTEMPDISELEVRVGPALTGECSESDRVYDYYLDELEESKADQVANHLDDCSYCQEVYRAIERVVTTLEENPQRFFPSEAATGTKRKKRDLPKVMEAAG